MLGEALPNNKASPRISEPQTSPNNGILTLKRYKTMYKEYTGKKLLAVARTVALLKTISKQWQNKGNFKHLDHSLIVHGDDDDSMGYGTYLRVKLERVQGEKYHRTKEVIYHDEYL